MPLTDFVTSVADGAGSTQMLLYNRVLLETLLPNHLLMNPASINLIFLVW